jgi:hypothetical protein
MMGRLLFVSCIFGMPAMAAMHEHVHQRTQQHKRERQVGQGVYPMLRPEVVTCDCEQPYEQEDARSLMPRGRWGRPMPIAGAAVPFMIAVHHAHDVVLSGSDQSSMNRTRIAAITVQSFHLFRTRSCRIQGICRAYHEVALFGIVMHHSPLGFISA